MMKKRDRRIGKPVCVNWDDAATRSSWADIDCHKSGDGVRVRTIGTLIALDNRSARVALNVSDDDGASDVITIPRACVRRIKTLKE